MSCGYRKRSTPSYIRVGDENVRQLREGERVFIDSDFVWSDDGVKSEAID